MIELTHMMHDNDMDVVGITETWAREEMSDAEFEIEGYQLYRKDHKAGHGGVTHDVCE